MKRLRDSRVARALLGLALAPVLALVVAAVLTPLPAELAGAGARPFEDSLRVLDRDGAVLREIRADDATRARRVPLEEMGPDVAHAMLAAEDARFRGHPGVDPIAVARAAASDLWRRRVVSGASTITMQLARLVRPHRRDLRGKFLEAAMAMRIEASLSKDEILCEYLNRAPFGDGVRGIDAGARYYFDKPPSKLSVAEAATLAAVPRGPHVYELTRHRDRALARRDVILARMLGAGWLSRDAYERALAEPLDLHVEKGTFGAPHLVQALRDGKLPNGRGGPLDGRAGPLTTTVSRALQREAEHATAIALAPLGHRHVTAASVVVVDNATGEVLAYVGSPDFSDVARLGQNDGVRAHRQPGSTLKPFVYALAMEKRGLDAASVVPDVELRLDLPGGTYAPSNYDEHFRGPVRVREALASSLNVPAVWVAHEVGEPIVVERLRALGFVSLSEDAEHYGPGIALGDGEVTLLELANAYATLARGGVWKPLRFVAASPANAAAADEARRVMPEPVARVITDILRDPSARVGAFGDRSALDLPFDVAAKTGTSKGFRDNWTIGYTREVTVAVWAGNFDGSPMEGVSGITGAAPIFRAVMEAAARYAPPSGSLRLDADADGLAPVAVCALSGGAPTHACHGHVVTEWLPKGAPERASCTLHEEVAIDTRNGLRAGPGCAPANVARRSFERYDGPLAAWAAAAHRATAPDAFSPLCPSAGIAASGQLRIGYPHDGTRFLLDPDRPVTQQVVSVRVEAPGAAGLVALKVDGRVIARAPSPYVVGWPLEKGSHELVAESAGLAASTPIRVRVD
jgi:penicillin-binding protein 1C